MYEKDKVGGLCRDNNRYQNFIHIFHTDNKKVWDYVAQYTDIKPYKHRCVSYVRGQYRQWPPEEMTQEVYNEQISGYSCKMWGVQPSQDVLDRIKLSKVQ